MSFQFTPWPNKAIAQEAYALPELPIGVSYELRQHIKRYTEAVLNGAEGEDEDLFHVLDEYQPQSLSDVIAKLIYRLHYDNSGTDDGKLVLIPKKNDMTLLSGAAVLEDLYCQVPRNWQDVRQAYHAAILAEKDYNDRIWMPAYQAEKAGGPPIPPAVNAEIERLQDVRCHAESVLLGTPAPTLSEFAIKYLICFDNGRDMNGWTDDLCAEAKRLLGISHADDADEMTMLLAASSWHEPTPPKGEASCASVAEA